MAFIAFVGVVLLFGTTWAIPCPMQGLKQCECFTDDARVGINRVTCEDLGHTTHHALQNLNQTTNIQTLVYTGNDIRELEANIFGECKSTHLLHLTSIDMSNNNIQVIHGKAFHCVPSVKILMLNYNEWRMDPSRVRVFSSMPSLVHLELHSAFYTGRKDDTNIHLREIFNGSEMNNLRELHLEQNGIQFIAPDTFCTLPNLDELHLTNNGLSKINFDCLDRLNKLYVGSNHIQGLGAEDIKAIEHMSLSILDLSYNPFQCTDCSSRTADFRDWLNTPSRFFVDKYKLQCAGPAQLKGTPVNELTEQALKGTCPVPPANYRKRSKTSLTRLIYMAVAIGGRATLPPPTAAVSVIDL